MLVKYNKYYNTLLKIFIIIFLVIILFGLLNISLDSDENFTIGIIHNTYSNIINFDSLDVHPPLYYLLLKLFLEITTFWTSNIFTKIIFARIFSLISGIIGLYFGIKLLKLVSTDVEKTFLPICVIFLSMPSILLYSQYIRMYILAAMFLFIELYELIKYVKYNKFIDLTFAVINGSFAAYTHYFAAISAGLLLFYFFIKYIYCKKYKNSVKIMLAGIVYLILYIPWMIIAQKQFSMATSSQYSTNQIYTKSTYTLTNFINLFKQALLSLVGGQGVYGHKIMDVISILLLLLFVYFIDWSIKNLNSNFNSLFIITLVNLLGTIIIGIFVSVVSHPILIDHYLFPSFTLCAFFMSYVIYRYIIQSFSYDKMYKALSCMIILLLLINVMLFTGHSTKNLFKSRVIITKVIHWRNITDRSIYIKNSRNDIWTIADDSIYLRSIHKNVKTDNFNNSDLMFGKPDVKLLHGVYPNIIK